ncbi:carbohydrate ABC transporter permease [Kosmotoga pacifica]|uniref:ABC transporter permease n=1 Tax=Kosmotoga pacifica TaxID=1330330 RepID=A0A0G2ZC03_9BACT|nr:carbohydrate ABC transporter permease [Kosmotoga pacifica]AKI97606.1 ABC transporter permease [Kosmotoga pacifica]
MNKKWRIGLIVSYIILIAYAAISLFPFIWSGLVSVTPMKYTDEEGIERGVDIMKWPPGIKLFEWPPKVFDAPSTVENYLQIFRITPYARWILNTVLYAVFVTVGHLLFDTLGGYAFARLRFPLRNFWFIMFLATLMIPGHVTMIPNYNLMVKFGFVNTYYGLFLPKLTGVFGLFLMRQFFLSIPRELEEAARMDGASIFKTYVKIVLPISKPAIAALAIYTFVGTWNDFLWPLLMTSDKNMYTLTVGLDFYRTSYYTFWQYMMAASILMTIPMIIIFLSFQRYFVESSVSTGLKG